MDGGVGIAELCAEHAVLAAEVVDLDRRIQALSKASPERYDTTSRSEFASSAKADILWLQLDDILNRQNVIVVELVDQVAGNAGELRDKGQTLATLLRTNRATENDLTRALSLSVVRDIMNLFS
jgi:hypothetical protein